MDIHLIINNFLIILQGLDETLILIFLSLILGFFISIPFALARVSSIKILSQSVYYYIFVIRGTPLLVQIYLIFFGSSAGIMYISKIFGYHGYIELNAFTMGTISIGIISAAYSTEVFRGAYNIIDIGQIEAARALGLSKINTFIKILGPQILKHALPGLGNVWQITLKDTALISVTGLVEIMRQSRIAANVTHSPLTFYLSAAVLYLILTTFSSKIFNKLEDYSNKNQAKV